MVIDKFGGFIHCRGFGLSIEAPPNAVEEEVQLEIQSVDAENIPAIQCDFGEAVCSRAVQVNPVKMDVIQFTEPIIFSLQHGITELPELSSIAMMCYNYENKKWERLPTSSGRD